MLQGRIAGRSTGFHASIESTTQLSTTVGSDTMTRLQPPESTTIHPISYMGRHMLTFKT